MKEQSSIHNTFVIERHYSAPPERVFSAFADAAKKRRWYAEGLQHQVESFEMDFRVGGAERTLYRFREGSPFPGVALSSEGTFEDIVDGERIVTAATMSLGDKRISSALVTVEFLRAAGGTDLICTHQAVFFEGADGPERREGGWRALFDRLGEELSR